MFDTLYVYVSNFNFYLPLNICVKRAVQTLPCMCLVLHHWFSSFYTVSIRSLAVALLDWWLNLQLCKSVVGSLLSPLDLCCTLKSNFISSIAWGRKPTKISWVRAKASATGLLPLQAQGAWLVISCHALNSCRWYCIGWDIHRESGALSWSSIFQFKSVVIVTRRIPWNIQGSDGTPNVCGSLWNLLWGGLSWTCTEAAYMMDQAVSVNRLPSKNTRNASHY